MCRMPHQSMPLLCAALQHPAHVRLLPVHAHAQDALLSYVAVVMMAAEMVGVPLLPEVGRSAVGQSMHSGSWGLLRTWPARCRRPCSRAVAGPVQLRRAFGGPAMPGVLPCPCRARSGSG